MAVSPLLNPQEESFLSTGATLHELFREVVRRNFEENLHLRDQELLAYVADLLLRFSSTGILYQIHDARGKRLDEVGQMLIASNPLLEGPGFDWEREVRKHIGDFTLFFAGLFPESVNRWRSRRERLDVLLDYIQTGKESYAIVAEFKQFEYRVAAPFFRKLSEEFERCVFGLNLVKRDFERMQQESYVSAKKVVG